MDAWALLRDLGSVVWSEYCRASEYVCIPLTIHESPLQRPLQWSFEWSFVRPLRGLYE